MLLKKRKTPFKLSRLSEFNTVLMPILSENENKDKIIEKLKTFDKVVLAFIMDAESTMGTASAGTKMKNAEKIIGELKEKLKGTEVKDHIEWGNTLMKLRNIALLEKVNKIMLVDTHRFKKDLEKDFEVVTVRTL